MRKVSRICFHCLKRTQSGRCRNPWTGNIMHCCRRIWRGVHSRHQSLPGPKEKWISASFSGMAADVDAEDTNTHTHKPSRTGSRRRCVNVGCSHLFAEKNHFRSLSRVAPKSKFKGKIIYRFSEPLSSRNGNENSYLFPFSSTKNALIDQLLLDTLFVLCELEQQHSFPCWDRWHDVRSTVTTIRR